MTVPVVIVGAGSAGLATAAALRRRRIPAVLLERGAGVGDSWRLRHEELRLNTTRRLSDLPGLRMPRATGRWPSRDDYVAYLEAYAEHHRLEVRFGVRALAIERSAHRRWVVRTDDGDAHADHVVIATGHERVAWTPVWSGSDTFTPPLVHLAELRRAADLAGRRVLLVGAGNSGIEFAEQLVAAGVAQLWLSVRTPPNILPLEIAGLPLQAIGIALHWLPERWRDAIAGAIARHAFGDLAPLGLPAPIHGPFRRLRTSGVTAAVDRGFVEHLKAGRLQIVPEIEHLHGAAVELRGGVTLMPDIVVAATGFRPALEPLVGHLGVLDAEGRPNTGPHGSLFAAPGLWLLGHHPSLDGNLRRHPAEARRIAAAISRDLPREADLL